MSFSIRLNAEEEKLFKSYANFHWISLSEAINMFLHQIKINNGIPFALKRKSQIELNDGYGSYICEHGHLHDYSKIDLEKEEKVAEDSQTYDNAKEMIEDILKEE